MQEVLRVLQVEDSESDAGLIERLLGKAGYDVHSVRVEDSDDLRGALDHGTWDVIISDHNMGQFDAPRALRILRESGHDIPFIVVSGSIGEEVAVTLMKSGAHDYVLKDNLVRLIPVVDREIREARSRHERRRAERELQDSQERLALAIQATQLGTFDFSPAAGKLICSELTKRHFGLPADGEASYDAFLQGIHPGDRERIDTIVRTLLQPGSDGQYAAEYRTIGIDDGVSRWISSWGRVFFDADGKPARFVGVTLDITERKGLEDQFRQAQKMESVGRLAGGVAHDFNNLLTVINGYSDVLVARLEESNPLHHHAAQIRKAGGRAAELTQQLLAFSRKQVIELKPVDLNQLVSQNRDMLGRIIGEDVELVTRLTPDVGNVFADAGQLHQVLMNLVVNARDAMPQGGRLTIETANAELGPGIADRRAGQYVLLVVADTGMGMDAETRKRIFEPFFTTKGEGVGTGLGLATVYGIVQQCGGWIDLTTQPGEGAMFTLGLPRVAASAQAEGATQERAAGGTETVLVVEDQDEVRRLAMMVLKTYGYRLLEARNGGEALQVVKRHAGPIDLMLTDVVMPGINGKELASRIRELRAGMPVLFMSGYSDNVISNGFVINGDVDYIAKPFTPQGLVSKVRAMLGDAPGLPKVATASP